MLIKRFTDQTNPTSESLRLLIKMIEELGIKYSEASISQIFNFFSIASPAPMINFYIEAVKTVIETAVKDEEIANAATLSELQNGQQSSDGRVILQHSQSEDEYDGSSKDENSMRLQQLENHIGHQFQKYREKLVKSANDVLNGPINSTGCPYKSALATFLGEFNVQQAYQLLLDNVSEHEKFVFILCLCLTHDTNLSD
jgi:hypothetical protein